MMEMKKILALNIILLFIGVAVAPGINQSVVTASQEDDLVEVTTQACGIKGYGDTTVKLTREQYQDLGQYLVELRARLNQTSTREEAVPIFKEAVVELNKYGLLPKGMSVEKAQRLVTGLSHNVYEKLLNKRQQKIFPNLDNAFCLLYIDATKPSDPEFPFLGIFSFPEILIGRLIARLYIQYGDTDFVKYLRKLSDVIESFPLKLLNIIFITGYEDFYSFGLKFFVVNTNQIGLLVGYTGLMLRPSDGKAYFFGFALAVV